MGRREMRSSRTFRGLYNKMCKCHYRLFCCLLTLIDMLCVNVPSVRIVTVFRAYILYVDASGTHFYCIAACKNEN